MYNHQIHVPYNRSLGINRSSQTKSFSWARHPSEPQTTHRKDIIAACYVSLINIYRTAFHRSTQCSHQFILLMVGVPGTDYPPLPGDPGVRTNGQMDVEQRSIMTNSCLFWTACYQFISAQCNALCFMNTNHRLSWSFKTLLINGQGIFYKYSRN